jgi:zinc transporter ZupT
VIVSAVESEAALSEAALIGIGAGGGVVVAALGVWFWRSRFPSLKVFDEWAASTSNDSGGWASAVAESTMARKSTSVWVSNPVSQTNAESISKTLLRQKTLANILFPKSGTASSTDAVV